MSSATCCTTALVSFPSKYIRVKYIFLLSDQRQLRTIEYLILDHPHSIIDNLRALQNLCSYHPHLFICQLVQPLQRIFYVTLSEQLLQVFFWEFLNQYQPSYTRITYSYALASSSSWQSQE